MIINPTPTTPATFDGMWITYLFVRFGARRRMQARLLQYNGEHLLATGGKNVNVSIHAGELPELTDELEAEIRRLSGRTEDLMFIDVQAPDPNPEVPVRATAYFMQGPQYVIPSCYALAGTDPVFAGVLNAAMVAVAGQAELEVSA